MDVRDALALTGASIRTHKLRSVLAAIGVVLGISSVIAVVTLGAGIQESIMGSIRGEFDADLLSVTLMEGEAMNGPPMPPNVLAFTNRDLEAIRGIPGVKEAGATAQLNAVEVRLGNDPLPGVRVSAHDGAHFMKLERGAFPTSDAEALVNSHSAELLAAKTNKTDVLGTVLTVRYLLPEGGFATTNVTIVGIQKASSLAPVETLTVGASLAPKVPVNGVPTTAWQSLTVRALSTTDLGAVKDRVSAYLAGESDARTLKGDRLKFRYDTQEEVAKLVSQGVGQFTAFIGAIGGVSLLVGLVGIANIMLVTVQERTREIGVMKATGASRGDILLLFLVEAVAICIVGAVLGIVLGSFMGIGLGAVISSLSPGAPAMPFVFQPNWYAIAVMLGVIVGLIAGLYPAWRAAKVPPIEALRYE